MKSQVQVASTTRSQVRLLLSHPQVDPVFRWDHVCVSSTVWNLTMEAYMFTNHKEYAVVMMRSLKASEEEPVTIVLYCEVDF